MLSFHGRFSNLLAHPPTPPRNISEDVADALAFLDDNLLVEDTYTPMDLDTPPSNSPSSSAEPLNTNACSKAAPKRVEFSPWTNYHKASTFDRSRPSPITPLRNLLPSRELKSSTSILKPFARPIPLLAGSSATDGCAASPYKYQSFAEMLESVVQQLAGEVRSARLDAYIALTGTLNACDGTPDSDAMQNKIGLIAQFIQRDMTATLPGVGTIDTPLITQAVKLADALLWNPVYSKKFDDDFRSFLIDRSILLLQDSQIPKTITRHHMYLLAKQNFDATILTVERVDRIITALTFINERVSGNGVIGLRLAVYNKLLSQAQLTMVARCSEWLPHVFHGMLSSIKETRDRAIELGMHAGRSLGHISQASKTVIELLDTEINGQGKYVDLLEARLKAIVESKDKELRSHVPQIWTVVILFFRNKRQQLDKWSHFKQWLRVIQRCFNSGDLSVKHQANIAWNRLVCIIGPDITTPKPIIKMLRQPLLTQLERKGTDGYAKKARLSALLSYKHLLYYAFQPSAPSEQIDLYWDEYVGPVLSNGFLRSHKDIKSACEILAALFGNSPSRTRNEDRANAALADMEPAELPQLDPKWIRRRVDKVLGVVSGCMNATCAPDSDAELYLRRAWSSLMGAIAAASNSEVRASTELKSAIAQIMNLLHRTWVEAVSSLSGIPSTPTARFVFLAVTAIENIGPIYFTDKILVRNGQSHFEAAATPSRRPDKLKRPLQSPLLHLLELLARSSAANHTGPTSNLDTVRTLLASCFSARTSRQAKLELLHGCADHLGHECDQAESRYQVWQAVADCTESVISQNRKATEESNSQHLGVDYRKVIKILAVGFQGPSEACLPAGESLLKSLLQRIKAEAGDGALVLSVAGPLSEKALEAWFSQENTNGLDNALGYGSLLLEMGLYHCSREVLEHGSKALWGVTAPSVKGPVFDPFTRTYELINRILHSAYEALDKLPCDLLVRFILALNTFLNRAPLSSSVPSLQRVQEGVATWVADSAKRLGGNATQFRELRGTILNLWKGVLSRLGSLPTKDSALLMALQILFSAGLRSRHRAIVNITVGFWNDSFGMQDTLEYPPQVELALRALRPFVELQLPTFPESTDNEYPDNLPSFIESQYDVENIPAKTGLDGGFDQVPTGFEIIMTEEHALVSKAGDLSLDPAFSPKTDVPATTAERRVRSPRTRQTSKARLRHENSQMHFAAIECSPLNPQALDSQMLTNRQREVRIRQQTADCALYPDIFSSPVLKAGVGADLVVKTSSNASAHASEGALPAALTEEVNQALLPPMDQGASILDDVSEMVPSSPPGNPRENDFLPQAQNLEAQEETGLHSHMCSEAATSSREEELKPSASNFVNIMCKEPLKARNVQQANQHGVGQPNTAVPVDEIKAPVVTVFVSDVTRASEQDVSGEHDGNCDESNMNSGVRVSLEKGLDRQHESSLTMGLLSAIPCLSPNLGIPLVQVDGTNEAYMGELQHQHNAVEGPGLNASAESVQAQEGVVENPATVFVRNYSANQEANINKERREPYGCRGWEVGIEPNQQENGCGDQSDTDLGKLDGNQVGAEPSMDLHSDELVPEGPASSPHTSRIDVFVDAPSSPLAEYPQVFVDASQTLMPIDSNLPCDLEPHQPKTNGVPLEDSEHCQSTFHSSDSIDSRVKDSFLGERGPLPPDAEVDLLRVPGDDSDQCGSQTSMVDSQATPKKTTKRKRSSWFAGKSAKRQKPEVSSAFPKLFNNTGKIPLGKEEEEDVGDCIVVACQPLESAQMSYHTPDARSVSRSRTRGQPSNTKKPPLPHDVASAARNSRKRRLTPLRHPTQDREVHATPRSSLEETVSPKRRKRSQCSQEEDARALFLNTKLTVASPPVRVFSHVAIPLFTKYPTRRNIGRQSAQALEEPPTSRTAQVQDLYHAESDAGNGLVVPTVEDTDIVPDSGELDADRDDSQVSQQVYAELEASLNTPFSSQRSVRQKESAPASNGILDRLKGILQDCKQMILGSSQDEREFDDVLFHLRREIHEAGRRGRTS